METPLHTLVSLFASQTDFADQLTAALKSRGVDRQVKQQNVSYWLNNPNSFPADCCIAAEELDLVNGQVTRFQLRPDVFGDARADVSAVAN